MLEGLPTGSRSISGGWLASEAAVDAPLTPPHRAGVNGCTQIARKQHGEGTDLMNGVQPQCLHTR